MFTPARSPVSTPAHPHTIPPCSYTPRPIDPTCRPTRVSGHPSHAHSHHRPALMVTTATSPSVSTTMAATPSPNVDNYGSYPQPQHLQLQWPPSASVATTLSPLPPSQFEHTNANSFSKFFFPVFYSLHPQLQCRDDDDCPPSLWPCGS